MECNKNIPTKNTNILTGFDTLVYTVGKELQKSIHSEQYIVKILKSIFLSLFSYAGGLCVAMHRGLFYVWFLKPPVPNFKIWSGFINLNLNIEKMSRIKKGLSCPIYSPYLLNNNGLQDNNLIGVVDGR